MAGKKSGAGGGGAVVLIVIAVWLVMWAVKILVIVLGVLLVIGGAVGGLAAAIGLIIHRVDTGRTGREADRFDREIDSLSELSTGMLRQELAAWDRIQLGRGVGTVLEKPFFTGTMPADLQRILNRVNALMTTGESAITRAATAASGKDRVAALDSIDRTSLELEYLRTQITH